MKSKKLVNRSAHLGMMLLSCCITLGLMTALSVAADPEKDVCTGGDMGSYAKLGFCLPPQVVVVPETMVKANYTSGKAVAASMLLDGSRVSVHLLYPCQVSPQKELKPAEIKPFLEAYDPIFVLSQYNDSIPGPVLWGQVENQTFVAYQPNNLTVALVMMDNNMSDTMMTTFLGNLSINLNEGATPLIPGYCPDTTVAPAEAASVSAETAAAPAEETAVDNPAPSTPVAATPTVAEIVKDNAVSRNEKMAADRAAALAKLEEQRKKMKGY
jgi:hypothetical protein